MKKKQFSIAIPLIIFLLLIIACLFGATMASLKSYNRPVLRSPESDYNLVNISEIKNCQNLSLISASECMRNWMRTYYNYTNDFNNSIRTFEEIKNNGGNCFDYTRIYASAAQQLGFHVETPSIFNGTTGHIFVIIYDNELNYCRLDQIVSIECVF